MRKQPAMLMAKSDQRPPTGMALVMRKRVTAPSAAPMPTVRMSRMLGEMMPILWNVVENVLLGREMRHVSCGQAKIRAR